MSDTWDWMVHSPVFLVLLTLVGYRIGRELRDRTGGHPLAQPVLVAIVVVGTTISLADVDYDDYRSGTVLIAFWLGPATVALAVPLHRQASRLRGLVVPMLVAIPLSDGIDGLPPLTAVLTIVAGILGAVAGPAVLTLLRIRDRRARGLALGAASHGIGTSRALVEDETEGAFSGLSMGLTALATSILLPLLVALLL